jgi:hypothetical protein
VAGRTAVDYLRRERRPNWVEIDLDTNRAAYLPSAEPSPEAEARERERLCRLAAGMA